MKRILTEIHKHMRDSRSHGGPPAPSDAANAKKYDRFKKVSLQPIAPLSLSLSDALVKRVSLHGTGSSPSLVQLGELLGHSLSMHGHHRPYPSGGGYYPVETYVFAFDVSGLERGIYHYRPDTHALEHVSTMPHELTSLDIIMTPEHDHYPLVLVCTGVWSRSHARYHDFALELALIETGHIMQNFQLVGTALGLGTRPLGGFKDKAIADLLDIELEDESVLCAMATGSIK